jgi:hypothetical protein
MAKIKYVHPALPDGEGFTIPGLNAVLTNNEAVDVDQEVIDEYESRTGNSFDDVSKSPNFTGKFPTPEEAAEASKQPDAEVDAHPEPEVETQQEDTGSQGNKSAAKNKTTTEGEDS